MYKKNYRFESLDIKAVKTRASDAHLFKTIILKNGKWKHNVFYNCTIMWNSLTVKVMNTCTYDSWRNTKVYQLIILQKIFEKNKNNTRFVFIISISQKKKFITFFSSFIHPVFVFNIKQRK